MGYTSEMGREVCREDEELSSVSGLGINSVRP
jgi:hypothetical protein